MTPAGRSGVSPVVKGGVHLLTRADDLGSFRSANRAILDAYRDGIVRNTSVLAVGGHFDEAAEMVRAEEGLCLGLHATITAEWDSVRWAPVLPADRVPGLVDERGHLVKQVADARDQGATVEEIVAEVRAQIEKARRAGLAICYLDTHMGFSWLDGVHDALVALCKAEGLLFHNTLEGFGRLPRDTSDHPVVALASTIRSLEPGNYMLIAHPAYDDEEMRAVHGAGRAPGLLAGERDTERRFFTDPSVVAAVRDIGADLVRYSEL